MPTLRVFDRERQQKTGSFAGTTIELERPAELPGQAAAEGQTKTDARSTAGRVFGRLAKRAKQATHGLLRQATSVIGDPELNVAVGYRCREVYPPIRGVACVLAGVVDQVEEDLLDRRRVGAQRSLPDVVGHFGRQLHVDLPAAGSEPVTYSIDQTGDGDRLARSN